MTSAGGDKRIFGLDLLRALAVLFVVYAHGYYLTGKSFSYELYNLPVFPGVTIFFVLSGFLIGRILLRTVAKEDFRGRLLAEFWVRRWFRTLPNYFLVLAALVVAYLALGRDLPSAASLAGYFTFTQNIAWPHPDFFPEAWSLAVEEWFYLGVPIPLYLATKLSGIDRRRLMLVWIAVVIVAVTAFRIYRVQRFGFDSIEAWDAGLRKQVLTRMDSLMFGVLGAYLSLYHARFWHAAADRSLAAGIALLVLDKLAIGSPIGLAYLNHFGLTVSSVGTLALLPKLSSWRRDGGRLTAAITLVSLISYSMYLLHLTPIHGLLLPLVMQSAARVCAPCGDALWLQYLTYWVLTVGCSYLLYRWFERPMTALRDRWPARGPVIVTAFATAAPPAPDAPTPAGSPDAGARIRP